MVNKKILTALAFIFLISLATAEVSHEAEQIYVNTGGSTETLQNLFTSGSLGKWDDGTAAGDIYYDDGNVGIGMDAPSTNLEVAGQVKITGGNPGAGKVLTSDAAGLASWQNLPASGDPSTWATYAASANVNVNDRELRNTRALKLKDWDDDTGGADSKYRLLARDGAWMFYNGGVVVGNYGDGTWGDLPDGRLIVEGNIGVRTTSPQTEFHVVGDGAIIRMQGSTHAYMEYYPFGSANRGAYLGFPSNGNDDFHIYNEDYEGNIVLSPGDSAGPGSDPGRVIIGGSGRRLQTQYDGISFGNDNYRVYAESSKLMFRSHTNGYEWLGPNDNIIMHLNDANGLKIYPTQSGDTPICRTASPGYFAVCSSLREYKKDIKDLEIGIGIIQKLRPVTFTWKSDGQNSLGFIAEEVYEVDPLLVTYNKDGEMEGVKYRQLTAVLTKAMQEQQSQIEELESELCKKDKSYSFC